MSRVPNQELESYEDPSGEIRRCGLLTPDTALLKAEFPQYETSAFPQYTEADCKKILADINRTKAREYFDKSWMMNQRSHGSCNGWGSGSALAKTRKKRGIVDAAPLSGSYVYSWINGGRDQGSALSDGMAELAAHGAPLASRCTWDMIYRSQTKQFDAEAAKNLGLASYKISSRDGLHSALAAGFIVVVAIQVSGNFVNFVDKTGDGVMPVFRGGGNHACHVDDMRWNPVTGQFEYDFNNSWGESWGWNGRAWCQWGSFSQTIGVHDFYAVVSTQES